MKKQEVFLFLAWVVALISTLGSFFLSQVMSLPPCELCWYQRICMFPLVIILWVGYANGDPKIHHYSLPLVIAGLLTAFYHNLLYYKLIAAPLAPCTGGVSCTERQLDLLGFISIPLMSLVSFAVILLLLILHLQQQGSPHDKK